MENIINQLKLTKKKKKLNAVRDTRNINISFMVSDYVRLPLRQNAFKRYVCKSVFEFSCGFFESR